VLKKSDISQGTDLLIYCGKKRYFIHFSGGMRMKPDVKRIRNRVIMATLVVTIGCLLNNAYAETAVKRSKGQTVYVPVYSHVYHGDREQPYYLTTTISVRNIDPSQSIKITSVEYFDSVGKLLKRYLEKPLELGPLASKHYSIKESDKSGGFGASFIVKWQATKLVNEPVIQCVMVTTRGQQGISFITEGRVIKE
jgi:hypothetical protein